MAQPLNVGTCTSMNATTNMAINPSETKAPWEAKHPTDKKHLIRRSLPWLGGGLLILFILWGLWPKPVVVETATTSFTPLTVRVSEEGKTRVRNRFVVAAPVAGLMRRVILKPGDEVKAGETMLTAIEPSVSSLLDPRARQQAEALIGLREAALQQTTQALDAARTASQLANADRDRILSVGNARAIAASDRDKVESEASIKASQLRSSEFALKVAEYELAQAQAALARGGETHSELVEVKSPVSGRILKVMQESETVVTPGTQILEIGDPADIEIEAEILSRDAVAIHPGDSVEIDQWGGDLPLKARVRRVEPAAFTKVSALGVEEQRVIVLSDLIDPPPAAQALGDRYRVEVRVATWHSDNVLTVPAGALFRQGNAWKTFLFQDGKAALATLEAGHSDGRFTEILSGLSKGDAVLLHPPDTVKDGTSVTRR